MPTYTWPTADANSVHINVMLSLAVRKANACSSASGSERKPTRPAADSRPTMMGCRRRASVSKLLSRARGVKTIFVRVSSRKVMAIDEIDC